MTKLHQNRCETCEHPTQHSGLTSEIECKCKEIWLDLHGQHLIETLGCASYSPKLEDPCYTLCDKNQRQECDEANLCLSNRPEKHLYNFNLSAKNAREEFANDLIALIDKELLPLKKNSTKNNTEMAYDRVLKMIESLLHQTQV